MNNQSDNEKDSFMLYLVLTSIVLVAAILLTKLSENEKYAPIRQQLDEESKQMNIRILQEYED